MHAFPIQYIMTIQVDMLSGSSGSSSSWKGFLVTFFGLKVFVRLCSLRWFNFFDPFVRRTGKLAS